MDHNLDIALLSACDDSSVAFNVAKSPAVNSALHKYCIMCKNCMSSKSVDLHIVCVTC